MNNLKNYTDEEIINLLKLGEITGADLTDSGIYPACFKRKSML